MESGPWSASTTVIDTLDSADDATLRATIAYCEAQLEGNDEAPTKAESEPADAFEGDAQQWADAVAESEAPTRATLTEKTISGNIYLYWQWSQGGKTVSEYIATKHLK